MHAELRQSSYFTWIDDPGIVGILFYSTLAGPSRWSRSGASGRRVDQTISCRGIKELESAADRGMICLTNKASSSWGGQSLMFAE
jgi:hypothetical protein